jgi:GMP synthase-like glutamine amidotransferase
VIVVPLVPVSNVLSPFPFDTQDHILINNNNNMTSPITIEKVFQYSSDDDDDVVHEVKVPPSSSLSSPSSSPLSSTPSSSSSSCRTKELHLMMLGCEESSIYGPNENIANMFMSIFQNVFSKEWKHETKSKTNSESETKTKTKRTRIKIRVYITIYNTQQKQYPKNKQEWDTYDGIIITGSLSTAYEGDKYDWIQQLIKEIQSNIHPYRRKTLGVCFGHQIYAHSFQNYSENVGNDLGTSTGTGTGTGSGTCTMEEESGCSMNVDRTSSGTTGSGLAVKCPKGTQVGKRTFSCLPLSSYSHNGNECSSDKNDTSSVDKSNTRNDITMLYTHSDMIQSIPKCAISLGGTENVPIQACAYFASAKEKDDYEHHLSSSSNSSLSCSSSSSSPSIQEPYAFTFQGHPEYASHDIGLGTYINILNFMDKEKKLPHDILEEAKKDALDNFNIIEQDCVSVMYNVMSVLGWIR